MTDNFVSDRTNRPIYKGDKVAYLTENHSFCTHVEIIEVVDVIPDERKILVNRSTRQTKILACKCIVLADRKYLTN